MKKGECSVHKLHFVVDKMAGKIILSGPRLVCVLPVLPTSGNTGSV